MRAILLAGAVLALGACSGGGNQANNAAADNMAGGDMSMNGGAMDGLNMGDPNMAGANMGDANMMGANGSVSAATGNGAMDAHTRALMKKDMKTHDHDTNLANGI